MLSKVIKLGTKVNHLARLNCSFTGSIAEKSISDKLSDNTKFSGKIRWKPVTRHRFEDFLKETFECPPTVARNTWLECSMLSEVALEVIRNNVEFLIQKGVGKSFILEVPSLMALTTGTLRSRVKILEQMKPEKIEDFVPLAVVSDKHLMKIKTVAEREVDLVPNKHRIYYFSELLNVTPFTMSKRLSNNWTVYLLEQSFKLVDQRLQNMLKYRSTTDVFNNMVHLLRNIPEHRLMSTNIPIYKCVTSTEETWTRLLKEDQTEAELFENGRSLPEYFAKRLSCDIEAANTMLKSHPWIDRCDVIKINEKLNYLLNEIGFNGSDIVQFPMVLRMSLDKIKTRIGELQLYGCRPIRMLTVVYQSSKSYELFLDKLKGERQERSMNEK